MLMRRIMMSMKPYYAYLIFEGLKKLEIRKSMPNLESNYTPVEVFVYMTKDTKSLNRIPQQYKEKYKQLMGYVCGKFVSNSRVSFYVDAENEVPLYMFHGLEKSCLTEREIAEYVGCKKSGCSWDISDAEFFGYDGRYDTDVFLFYNSSMCDHKHCKDGVCFMEDGQTARCDFGELGQPVFKPPQSWCYIQ